LATRGDNKRQPWAAWGRQPAGALGYLGVASSGVPGTLGCLGVTTSGIPWLPGGDNKRRQSWAAWGCQPAGALGCLGVTTSGIPGAMGCLGVKTSGSRARAAGQASWFSFRPTHSAFAKPVRSPCVTGVWSRVRVDFFRPARCVWSACSRGREGGGGGLCRGHGKGACYREKGELRGTAVGVELGKPWPGAGPYSVAGVVWVEQGRVWGCGGVCRLEGDWGET